MLIHLGRILQPAITHSMAAIPSNVRKLLRRSAMKFRPLHDRVVVKRIEAEEKTAGGIVKEGAKVVAAGVNPMDLKRGIDRAIAAVIGDIEKNSKKITSNDEIAQVATISANGDAEIG